MRYGITGVFGERENGKTTYMVKHLLKEVHSGRYYDKAFCNIEVKDPKVELINYKELLELKLPAPHGIPRAIVGLDQIHKYMDARRSNSAANVAFSQMIVESRQHGFDLIYTTWMRSVVDKRLRPFTALYVLAQRAATGFEYDLIDKERGELGIVKMPWEMARQVWAKFDSAELIEDVTIPDGTHEQTPPPPPKAEDVKPAKAGTIKSLLEKL
jgi:hypothetical protein